MDGNLLYFSVHSINEQEDLKLFSEFGFTCISTGTYNDPEHLAADAARPPLPGLPYFPELNPLAKLDWVAQPTPSIPQKLIDWADIIYFLGFEGWLPVNWERIRHKKVIWRSIGQAVPHTESVISRYRPQGLKVIRYSPLEKMIPGYAGEDILIRFYKDEDEYNGWTGARKEVVTVAQSMKYRNAFLRYDAFEAATRGLPRALYGNGNEPGRPGGEPWWRGPVPYEELKRVYRESRVFFYTGTRPAPYTMGFMEAMTTGTPIVAAGPALMGYFVETPHFIEDGVSGFVSDSIGELRERCQMLLEDDALAARIGRAGREAAIRNFSYKKVKEEWRVFFESL